ncbi:MAG: 50S ribosomal protein L23 [Chloroflexi bacterium]|nr:MAG: 50S ribosomal protein L23 [Phototrophicales bacterium]RMF82411.1 MAG: 50S ribosomal protein L23 [Chloroflexota bacterium]
MNLHLYDVIVRPVVSEKSTLLAEYENQYVFEVAPTANKIQIREAIETIFDVDVVKVRTMVMPAKRGQRGRKKYRRTSQWKKAIVTLAPGDSIDLFDQ